MRCVCCLCALSAPRSLCLPKRDPRCVRAQAQTTRDHFPVFGAATTLEKWVFIKYNGKGQVVFSETLAFPSLVTSGRGNFEEESRALAALILYVTNVAAEGARKPVRGAAVEVEGRRPQ